MGSELRSYNQFGDRRRTVRANDCILRAADGRINPGISPPDFVVSETNERWADRGFQDRFDEDDFAAAYAELERRHYAGEGAPYAEGGAVLTHGPSGESAVIWMARSRPTSVGSSGSRIARVHFFRAAPPRNFAGA